MIQPTGRAVLRALGLEAALLARGSRIDRLIGLAAGSGRIVLDVRYDALGPAAGVGTGIHRAALFDMLFEAVTAAGIELRPDRTIAGSAIVAGGGRALLFADGTRSDGFDLVVDALGTRTPLAPPVGRTLPYGALWATLDWPDDSLFDAAALQQRYRAASIMAGVLPIGTPDPGQGRRLAFFWSLRRDRLQAWRDRGLAAWKRDVAALWPETGPLLDQIAEPAQLTFATYAHRTLRRPVEPALVHIGDAWHSTSPQLGQGANMALLDAYALAQALGPEARSGEAAAHMAALRARHVRLYQAISALFTPVYQSDSRVLPVLRDRLIGPASRLWPATWIQAALVSGLVGDPLRPLGLGR